MTARTVGAVTAALVLVTVAPADARPTLRSSRMKRLGNWEVLGFSQRVAGSNVRRAKAIGVIPAPPRAVLRSVLNVDDYKRFMPRVTHSRVTRRDGRKLLAVIATDLPWPMEDAWAVVRYTVDRRAGGVYSVRWKMIEGTLKQYRGHALIEPWTNDGRSTAITIKLLAEPNTMLPDGWISRGVQRLAEGFIHRHRMRITGRSRRSTANVAAR